MAIGQMLESRPPLPVPQLILGNPAFPSIDADEGGIFSDPNQRIQITEKRSQQLIVREFQYGRISGASQHGAKLNAALRSAPFENR